MSASGDDIPRCPVCLSPCRTDQRYCLECGARLGAAPPRRVARVPLPTGRPTASAIAALIVVALVGILAAWGLSRGGDDEPTRTAAASSGRSSGPDGETGAGAGAGSSGASSADTVVVTLPPATTVIVPTTVDTLPATTELPPTTFETPTDTFPTEPTVTDEPPTTDDALPPLEPEDAWVDDGAWAVILISREVGTVDADDMSALEARAEDRGVRRVGTLLSDNWTSLNPGFWVLYQGPFDTERAARSAARAAQGKGYPGAYPRRVSS